MKILRFFTWLLRAVLFLILIAFALKNTNAVTLRFFLDTSWQLPLIALLLLFLAIGVVLGLVAALGRLIRARKEIQSLRRELNARAPRAAVELTPPPPADAAG